MIRQLTDDFFASPQISTGQVQKLKEHGFDLIVCNRPDNEEPGQPTAEEMAAAAKAAEIEFAFIPVGAGGVSGNDLDSFLAAIDGKIKTIGFCKSGLRSVMVRSMAMAKAGTDIDQILADARNGGFDISGQRPVLEKLAEA